jgi:Acyclic terpene utilisation family protein AtuA
MRDSVRIGCYAAFWGDTGRSARQLLRGGDVHYLVSDYLAEITMALLARARAREPDGGYVPDAVATLAPLLSEIAERGIRVVTNGGALNPLACAEALRVAAAEAGTSLKVAAVTGDDLLPRLEGLRGTPDMFTGAPLPERVSSMNAYLGARPIADALAAGADIVVNGRCVDAAVVLGPLMHEFGWRDEDHDLLAAGSLIGHVLECGPQCAGGIHTDWDAVPGWEDMGYPLAECRPDGTATIEKPRDTGGLLTAATVGEQILYEIGDPGAYVMADVVCDWRDVRVEQAGPDRVTVSGARGSAPTRSYKVTATITDGYRSLATAMFAGIDAAGRARRAGEALVARVGRLLAEDGRAPVVEASIEVIGGGDTFGDEHRPDAAIEAVLKVGVRHPEREALQVFASEFAPMSLVAQGMTGIFAGRPRIAPVFRVHHLLVDKDSVPIEVVIGDERRPVAVAVGEPDAVLVTAPTAVPAGDPPQPAGRTVPLRRVAWGRSGDKGDKANIGLIARHPDLVPILRDQVPAERVARFFGHYLTGAVDRWELPGLHAFNYLLDGVLGGAGGTSTLRYDPQAKSYAAMLLTLPVTVPPELDRLLHP